MVAVTGDPGRLGLRLRRVVLTTLALLPVLVAGCGSHSTGSESTATSGEASHDHGAMSGGSMGGLTTMSDTQFIEMMVPHHQMAIDMSAIVLKRGTNPQVKQLATAIIAAQKTEIATMSGWYRDLTGKALQPMQMSADDMAWMGMGMDMGELESTKEPDRVFLRMMVPHHAGAIVMADQLAQRSKNAEMAAFAKHIVAHQATEVGQMQTLRAKIAPPEG